MTGGRELTLWDYGVGNLYSLGKGLERAGFRVRVTRSPGEFLRGSVLVLPGVGGWAWGSRSIRNFRAALREKLEQGTPCLCVCLGMQLLYESSEEASGPGIGLLPGRIRRLKHRQLPHVGWSSVRPRFRGCGMFQKVPRTPYFYFVHSYAASASGNFVQATARHGRLFAAAVRRYRTWGVQFHPEKSSTVGLRLLSNFAEKVNEWLSSPPSTFTGAGSSS